MMADFKNLENSEQIFSRLLRAGIIVAVSFISFGGLFYLIDYYSENYHTVPVYKHSDQFMMMKIGLFILILLQIVRVLFYFFYYLSQKEIFSAVTSIFVGSVLVLSFIFAIS